MSTTMDHAIARGGEPISAVEHDAYLHADGYSLTARQVVSPSPPTWPASATPSPSQSSTRSCAIDAHMRFDGDLTGWTTGRTPTDVATILARAEADRPRLLRRRLPADPLVAAHDHHQRHRPRPRRDAHADLSLHQRKLLRRAGSPDLHRWLAHTAGTRGCHHPVRLTGQLHTVDTATGRIIDTRHTTDHARRRALRALRRPPRLASARRAPRPTAPTPTN